MLFALSADLHTRDDTLIILFRFDIGIDLRETRELFRTKDATSAIRMNERSCERYNLSIDQPRITLFKASRTQNNITHEAHVTECSVT